MKYPAHLTLATFALAGAAIAVPTLGQPATTPGPQAESPGARAHATLSLISNTKAWQPGETLLLAFNLDIEDGWHTYWRGVSDTGQPPEFKLTLPDGFVAGEWIWPAPRREIIKAVNALDHVYEHRLTVVVMVQTPAPGTKEAEATSAHFAASGMWLVCKSACVPEKGEAALDLPRGHWQRDEEHVKWIEETGVQKPKRFDDLTISTSSSLIFDQTKGTYSLSIPGATEMIFFPDKGCIAMPQLYREGRVQGPDLTLTLAPQDDPTADRIKGLLKVWGVGGGTAATPLYVEIDEPTKPPEPPKTNHEPDMVK